ncbi:MAG TPA: uracil-DNA glycosylase family protein [Burkholderiaceae bacterium]|nr:uracil-DNA glycosylase family protein [Burkholderiaceae bacterium]
MDERRRRAWDALGLGPAWTLRDPPGGPPPGEAAAHDDAQGRADDPAAAPDLVRRAAETAEEFARAKAADGGPERHATDGASGAPDPRAAPAIGRAGRPGTDTHEAGPGTPADAPSDAEGAAALAGSPSDAEGAAALAGSPTPQSVRVPAIARMSWDEIADAVSGCTACTLCASRRNTVFGAGPQPAPWMLIGEAPGEQEDERGEPFVGPAGQLLDRMLASIGVDRPREAFVANVLKCRPPRNRDPSPEEVARCEPYLLRQLELVRPRLVIALGRFAAQSLLRTDATIASLRGRVHGIRAGELTVPTVVTYHPAYLLRNLPDKSKAWADLRLARRTFDSPPR